MVPHLVTALKGPLLDLERRFLDASPGIERWFRLAWQEHTPPFYCSSDLRNAGYKLAPVDTNLFPGSFNNLSPDVMPLAVQAAMAAIEKYCPDARNLLLVVGRGMRNSFYLEHVKRLAAIMRQTGLNVRFGSLDAQLRKAQRVELPGGQHLGASVQNWPSQTESQAPPRHCSKLPSWQSPPGPTRASHVPVSSMSAQYR